MTGQERQTRHERLRLFVQGLSAALTNGYAAGFLKGTIFTGKSKIVCVPVLNCYSCPGALGACPIGSFQAVAGSNRHSVSFYVLGLLMLFALAFGRLFCGFLCPFGLVQELLHRLPVPKLRVPAGADRVLRWGKYAALLLLVALLPALLPNRFGVAPPYFCKWVCPAGTLGGALPLLLKNRSLRACLGLLFRWKLGVLLAVLAAAAAISRPFCKYLCPLGAFYGLFNPLSLYRLHLDRGKCVGCGQCQRSCPMGVPLLEHINSRECIRCGRCQSVCPRHAITSSLSRPRGTRGRHESHPDSCTQV